MLFFIAFIAATGESLNITAACGFRFSSTARLQRAGLTSNVECGYPSRTCQTALYGAIAIFCSVRYSFTSAVSFSSDMNRMDSSAVTSMYATSTGLYSTSLPRRFVSHATSSSIVTSIPSAPHPDNAERSLSILDTEVSPLCSTGKITALPAGTCGRFSHIVAKGSVEASILMSHAPSSSFHPLTSAIEQTVASTPTHAPGCILAHNHSVIEGVSARPSFISSTPVPARDFSAASQ